MSSGNRDTGLGEEPERKQISFVRSVINVLSGSRFSTPEGSGRNSPIADSLEAERTHREVERNRSPEELENLGPVSHNLYDERGYDREDQSLPMGELEKEFRLMGGSSQKLLETIPGSERGLLRGTERVGAEFEFRPYSNQNGASERMDESVSVRVGHQDAQNITRRDTKRPRERAKDKVYKQRFSMVSSADMGEHRLGLGSHAGMVEERGGVGSRVTPAPFGRGLLDELGHHRSPVRNGELPRGPSTPDETPFAIFLTYAGKRVSHRVSDSMLIWQLTVDAGLIFGLDPDEVSLILFSGSPTSLQKNGRISGPPRVSPGSTVMVFQIPALRTFVPSPLVRQVPRQEQLPDYPLPALSPKLLATFKFMETVGEIFSKIFGASSARLRT